MHNNIMAAGSRDRPPMLATGRYAQWRSRFLRYIDTRPNGDALRKCILIGPYTPTSVTTPAVPATEDSPLVPEQTTVETVMNMTPENRAHFESEKEAIHLILTGIGDEIYSTVDACQTAQEMWEAIERLQQGESLNIQDVKTNLFWEFGQFTSHDGETIESYYTRFYKMMNEMIRNNLTVATMQVNVQFLQQLQPEWSRFVTIVKQQHKLDEVSYHKLFDILKQYQKEVNELRAERMAKNANPLALVATAQTLQDPYYQTSKPHKSYAPTSKASLPTRSHATTRYKGKEIAKPITPPSESASEEDSDPEQAQKDKDMQKNLALIAKYFKKLYKPTNNNLRTSSNTRNKNVDTTPRYKNDNQTGQFGNQRAVNVVGARETVGGPVVQQSGIQCFNCKEFGHYAKECRKPKRVKDSTYHKEKMLLCKQAEKGVQLQAEQSDWLADTDEEIDEQELEAHYSYMAKIQEVPNADSGTDAEPLEQVQYDTDDNVFANDIQHFDQSESISNTCAVETGDSNVTPDSPDMCDNDIQDDQNDVECDDERVALANLIANLKLDVDENKKIQKQLKKANATLTQELTECKSILAETSRTLGESNSIRDSCLVALQNKQTEFERFKAFNDRTVDYDKLERRLNETLGLLAQKEIDIKESLKVKAYEISVVKEKHDELVKQSLLTKSHYEGLVKEKTKVITDLKLKEEKDIDKMISMENQLKFLNEIVYKRSQSIQTIHMLAPKCPTFNGRPTFANPMYLKKAQYEKPCLYAIPHDQSDPANRLVPDREETLTLDNESRSKLNKDLVKPFDYTKLNSLYEIFKPPTQHYEIQFAQANEIRKKMWRKSFVKTKPNIFKNINFLPVSKSISKSRQAYNVMTNNINHLKEIVDQAWVKHSNDRLHLRSPTAQDMEILIKICLMPLALKTQNDSFAFVHELKQEMHADLKVESLEDEIDELESNKAEFSNMYDMLLQECVSKDDMCS
ncbi:retrovirus-related pol polyprotein from transposon TNT 1-94 [Tanacetum coccineum]